MKFRKKYLVEAEQYTADGDMPFADDGYPLCYDEDQHCQYIQTLEGRMIVNEGDWVVKGIAGEFHPVRRDIFEATYEAVEE